MIGINKWYLLHLWGHALGHAVNCFFMLCVKVYSNQRTLTMFVGVVAPTNKVMEHQTRCIAICNIECAHIFLHLKVKILIQNLSFTDCVLTLYLEGRPHLR